MMVTSTDNNEQLELLGTNSNSGGSRGYGSVQRDNNLNTIQREKKSAEEKGKRKTFIEKNIFMWNKDGENDKPTDCYGTIEFRETTKRSPGKFIRFTVDTEPSKLFKFMTEHWGIEAPKLLISVTGGAKSFDISERLKKDFHQGLKKVASAPGAWVISGGTNTGVMEMVGEANRGTTNVCIGVATWGIIVNNQSLIPSTEREIDGTFPYDVGSYLVLTKDESYLDHHHTHFLLVDDGTEGTFGGEIEFRGKFEGYVMKESRGKEKIPTVLLVLEGGPGTLETVGTAVENDVPCVLVKGSGKTADLLAYALHLGDKAPTSAEPKHAELLKGIRTLRPGHMNDENIEKCYKIVIKCLQKKENFTVVDQESGIDTDDAILTALLKDKVAAPSDYEKLRLTLLWNRVDLARKVMSPMIQWNEGKDDSIRDTQELHDLMVMALAMNRKDFVKMFLDYGVSMMSLLTKEVVEFLYAYRSVPTTPSTVEWEGDQRQDMISQGHSKKLYKDLLSYSGGKKLTKIDLEVIKKKLFELLDRVPEKHLKNIIEVPDTPTTTFASPYRQLFIWAVLNNMLHMAVFLWEFVEEDTIGPALIAFAITDGLIRDSSSDDTEDEEEESLKKSLNTYNRLSIQLMDALWKNNEASTKVLVTKKLCLFNELSSSLDFAVATEQPDFVAHRAIQDILDEVWAGSIKSKHNRGKVLASILVPPLLLEIKEEKKLTGDHGNNKCTSCCSSFTGFWKKLYRYNVHSPVVKFYHHTLGYLCFLILFAYVAMMEKKTTTLDVPEIVLTVTVAGYALGEVYQVIHIDASSLSLQLKKYICDFWNLFDVICIVLFVVALSLGRCESTLELGHLFYAIDVSIWIVRIIRILHADPISGPYVVMIGKMFNDFLHFISILFIFLLSYGVAVRAILEPSPGSPQMLVQSLFKPYFNIYGELFIDDPDTNKTWFGTNKRNSYAEPIAFIYMSLYLLIVNILLLNLLIAIFNSTYVEVMSNASRTWKFNRYALVLVYSQQRCFLWPPFNLIWYLWLVIQWLLRKCCCETFVKKYLKESQREFGLKANTVQTDIKLETLKEFESNCLIYVIEKRHENENFEMEVDGGSPTMPRNELEKKFDELLMNNENLEGRMKKHEKTLDSRMYEHNENMESRMIELIEQNKKLLEETTRMLGNENELKGEIKISKQETAKGKNSEDSEI